MFKLSAREAHRLNLSFEQKMQLWQFRVRVLISFLAFVIAMLALIFDIPTAKRNSTWFTGLVSFIIGWWMPSPGNTFPINTQQEITANRAVILQQNDDTSAIQ